MKPTLITLVLFLMGMSYAANGGHNRGGGAAADGGSAVEEPQGAAESEGTGVSEDAVEPNGNGNGYRHRWGQEFQNGLPADLKEKVEALREEADKKREIIREATPEQAEVVKSQWRRGAQQKRDAAVDALPEETRGKVRGMLQKIDDKNTEKDEDIRQRINYRERLWDCEIPCKIPEDCIKEKTSLDVDYAD